ncbi:MAG: SPOR domain-containing protein [Deltaproteobacteria bacterium]|nr:SPOR domain-containing protein [Deltaproteobacteria bacterium]
MRHSLKEKQFSWFSLLFVLPNGRRIPPLLVLVPVFLIVGGFARHLYRESRIRPVLVKPLLEPIPVSIPVVVSAPVSTPTPTPTLIPTPAPAVYSIRLGKGKQMKFVDHAIKKLQGDSLEPFYQKMGDHYWVLVGRFSDINDAKEELNQIAASGKYKGDVVTLTNADPVSAHGQ